MNCVLFHSWTVFLCSILTEQEYDVEDSLLPLQPSLNYTAPELVRSKTSSVGCSSDIFSFGCLAYHLLLTSLCLTATTMWRWYCFNIIYSILSDVYSHTRIFIISISFFWQDRRVAYCLMLLVLVRKTIFTFFCPSYFIFIGLELHYAPSIFVVFSCNFQPFSTGFWD